MHHFCRMFSLAANSLLYEEILDYSPWTYYFRSKQAVYL